MKSVSKERVRRRVLEQAVAENIETIQGLPPRGLRSQQRVTALWLRRAPLLLVPLTLAASTYFATTPAHVSATIPRANASMLKPIIQAPAASAADRSITQPLTTDGAPLQRVAASAFPLAVRRVVLDSGHGGNDPGASSLGLAEKDVTLDIGHRLRHLLEQNGFEVVSTRPDDRTIALRERARMANNSRSDIFVSIHVNSLATHVSSHGVETYYLGPTNDPSLTRLAAAENTGSGYSMADLRKLLDGIYADARRDESLQLAQTVQQQLFTQLRSSDPGLSNWGVKRAPFVVLVATDMPAILAEVGCISNDKEAAMLGRPEYRQKIAEALFHGIHAYAGASEAPHKKGS